MAPPGRRRVHHVVFTSSMFNALLIALLILSPAALAAQAVLGIDLGTEYIKAAMVKPGIPLEIVLTKDSKRKEASAVAFKASGPNEQFPERFYGADALALAPRFPGDVYPNLKQLLGAVPPFGNAAAETFKARYPALDLVRDEKFEKLSFQSKGIRKEDGLYTVEELLAMELAAVKANAEAMAGKADSVRDVVIAIPPFYTAEERAAVGLAADLAGLRILGLISDGMAVGLNYATPRTFDEKPEINLVYDMGSGSTTATILKFEAKKVKDVGRYNKAVQEISVLGTGWDRTLGGDALNDVLIKDMVEKFVESKPAASAGIQASAVLSHGRTMAKLRREATRLRQVLSANTETSANFEGLYEDIDFKYKLNRPKFETLASRYVDRVGNPIAAALEMAGLTIDQVDAIIVHGGAVRTPFVQNTLEKIAGSPAKLKSNVNADEAAVFGAAFKAAGLSPSFKVKDIRTREFAAYTAVCEWAVNGKQRSQNIFIPSSLTGTVKDVPFKNQEDFSLYLNQVVPSIDGSEEIKKPLAMYSFTNLTASVAELIKTHGCAKENITTTISMRLDPVGGLPEVYSGSVSCEAQNVTKKSMVEGVKDLFGFGSKDEQKPLSSESEDGNSTEHVIEIDLDEKPENKTSSDGATGKSSKKGKDKGKSKNNKVQHVNLLFTTAFMEASQPTQSSLDSMKARLADYDRADKGRRLREELFNTLESYTYKARDMLTESGFMGVSTEEQRNAISKQIQGTSDWLYADGVQASLDAVKDKLQELQSLVEPVQKRKGELTSRPKSIKVLQDALGVAKSFGAEMVGQIEKAAASISAAASSASEVAAETASSSPTELAAEAPTNAQEGTDAEKESEPENVAPPTFLEELPLQLSDLTAYTDLDVSNLADMAEEIQEWLEEKLERQNKLADFDEPILLSDDMETYAKQLTQFVKQLKKKTVRSLPLPKSKSNSKKAKDNSKETSTTTATITLTEEIHEPVATEISDDHYRGSATTFSDDATVVTEETPHTTIPINVHEEL